MNSCSETYVQPNTELDREWVGFFGFCFPVSVISFSSKQSDEELEIDALDLDSMSESEYESETEDQDDAHRRRKPPTPVVFRQVAQIPSVLRVGQEDGTVVVDLQKLEPQQKAEIQEKIGQLLCDADFFSVEFWEEGIGCDECQMGSSQDSTNEEERS